MSDWRGAAVVLAGSVPYSISLAVATLRARASRQWPRVAGVLARSEFFIGDTDALLYAYRRRGLLADPRSKHILAALPTIVYDYRVGSSAYIGTRLRFGPVLTLPAEHWIRGHTRGSSVSVAYNPRKPNVSVLEPGVSRTLAISLLVALCFVGLGVWWLVLSLRG